VIGRRRGDGALQQQPGEREDRKLEEKAKQRGGGEGNKTIIKNAESLCIRGRRAIQKGRKKGRGRKKGGGENGQPGTEVLKEAREGKGKPVKGKRGDNIKQKREKELPRNLRAWGRLSNSGHEEMSYHETSGGGEKRGRYTRE